MGRSVNQILWYMQATQGKICARGVPTKPTKVPPTLFCFRTPMGVFLCERGVGCELAGYRKKGGGGKLLI